MKYVAPIVLLSLCVACKDEDPKEKEVPVHTRPAVEVPGSDGEPETQAHDLPEEPSVAAQAPPSGNKVRSSFEFITPDELQINSEVTHTNVTRETFMGARLEIKRIPEGLWLVLRKGNKAQPHLTPVLISMEIDQPFLLQGTRYTCHSDGDSHCNVAIAYEDSNIGGLKKDYQPYTCDLELETADTTLDGQELENYETLMFQPAREAQPTKLKLECSNGAQASYQYQILR